MDITKVLLSNYLPYAKGTIIGRAIPSIDGLKPAQRRILYTMYKMSLLKGNKAKSSKIVGQTMSLHPHGDMAIYETMIRMAVGHDALNCPYIESKGNFGKVYSDSQFAAMRYTEAKLSNIAKELFDGIDENGVDFIPNFDNTDKEPVLLPVKFPNILVNPSSGIAVGASTNIPSFALKNVCDATIGVIEGKITDAGDLMKVLGIPEFTTGGYVHAGDEELLKLGETGCGTLTLSGTVVTYPNSIVITEIPYGTKMQKIIDEIEDGVKSGTLREISNVSDEEGFEDGLKMVVEIKRGYDSRKVLQKLCALTSLRMKVSFRTRVILNNRLEELGLLSLLHHWIDFRMTTINRVYNHKLGKISKQVHLLEAWDKIKSDMQNVAKMIADKNELGAKQELMRLYKMDELQADYILDMKIKMFTQDNLNKKLNDLNAGREEIRQINTVLNSDEAKKKLIVEELSTIRDKYGDERKTIQAPIIPENQNEKEEVKIDDTKVSLILTKSGYLKRLVTLNDISRFELPDGEEVEKKWFIKNDSYLLVFTYSGEVRKILIDEIDASKNGLKDELYKLCGLKSADEIMYVDATEDYSGYFNLLYPNGRGTRVYYSKASGKRDKYVGLYDACERGNSWITTADKFFMVTRKRKAAYSDLTLLGAVGNRTAFKVARVTSGDSIFGIQPVENVPDIESIDTSRYTKGYTINIGEDVLWESNKE